MTTSDFIVELGTEELPPIQLPKLSRAFHDLLINLVAEANLGHKETHFYATPRRLTVIIKNLALAQDDLTIQREGPAVVAAFKDDGSATPAALGFAKSCGVSVDQLDQVDTPKGKKLCFQIQQQGKTSADLLPILVEKTLKKLPIAKAMRWGDYQHNFIRPVKWLLMMQGNNVIPCTLYNCKASNLTRGHRFLSSGDLVLNNASEYLSLLKDNFVLADFNQRKEIIKSETLKIAKNLNANAVIEPKLLDEVTALVEWPVALAGNFDPSFLSVPQEALISSMATNQKYFHLEDDNNKLLPYFITIANIPSKDPNVIIKGNEKVIRPRLADANFFYNQDCKRSLSSQIPKLKKIVFQKDLGSIFDKTNRIEKVACSIATTLTYNVDKVSRAAQICKSDLLTDMVGEFPSLQGIMGRYYALNDGEDNEIASAMDEIYRPRFGGDFLPKTAVGTCLALADRLDTLVGIFAVGLVPTGNKDPFALRRASLGILRILIEQKLPLDIATLIELTASNYTNIEVSEKCKNIVLNFFMARLKALYLDQGYSSQTIQAVLELNIVSLVDFDARIKAVKIFSELKEAASLAEANKRVANIISKNSKDLNISSVNESLLSVDQEKKLYHDIQSMTDEVNELCNNQQYTKALSLLVQLKPSIDNFFDSVMVIDDDLELRKNRLALLTLLRNLFLSIADISYLQI